MKTTTVNDFHAAFEGWEPILNKDGKVMGYRTKPLVEAVIQYWPIEAVVKGPQPEAHKSIHDYRDQLAAKKKRRKRSL